MNELSTFEFDEVIKTVIENFNLYDERGIKSDFSYNLSHIDEYRNYAITDLKL